MEGNKLVSMYSEKVTAFLATLPPRFLSTTASLHGVCFSFLPRVEFLSPLAVEKKLISGRGHNMNVCMCVLDSDGMS